MASGNDEEKLEEESPAEGPWRPSRSEIVKALLCAALAVAAPICKATGFIVASWPAVAASIVCFLLFAAAHLVHGRQSEGVKRFWRRSRPVFVALCVPASFFLLEQPFNEALFSMDLFHLAANLCLFAVLFLAVYTLCQRTAGGIVAFLSVSFAFGIANHFVDQFKGQPVTPADLLAISTAASVSSGYSFEVDANLLACFVFFVGCLTLVSYLPKVKRDRRQVAVNLAVAIVSGGAFGLFVAFCPVDEALDGEVDLWAVADSYSENGSLLSFLDLVQELFPEEPEDYDAATAAALLAAQDVESAEDDAEENEETLPTVVVVMNETFSDLSSYSCLEDSGSVLENYYAIAEDSIASGTAYVSVVGGGTCNSEFEFLTGASLALLGGGTYPYLVCDLAGSENLASYFSALGYTTWAIHPSDATNWDRDEVYAALGFDEFIDISAFEDAETLRGLVTDAATYDCILELIEEGDGPQFIFDVTIQNHSGYGRGGIDEEDLVSVELADGSTSSELDEYLSCLAQSDEDLAYLVEELNELDEPVVLLFFGDHQPDLAYWLFEESYEGLDAEELAECVEERYAVPYLIWANDAAIEAGIVDAADAASSEDAVDEDDGDATSLNYLGATLVELCGLPLTSYQSYLLELQEEIPALNAIGYLTADGEWHWLDEESGASDLLDDYAILQYDNLFNKSSARSALWVGSDLS